MPNPDQIDIRCHKPREFTLEFPFNQDFIDYLKSRIPANCRRYDGETHIWTIQDYDGKRLAAVEGIAVQKFPHAIKWYHRDGKLVMRNLKTGQETVQA